MSDLERQSKERFERIKANAELIVTEATEAAIALAGTAMQPALESDCSFYASLATQILDRIDSTIRKAEGFLRAPDAS